MINYNSLLSGGLPRTASAPVTAAPQAVSTSQYIPQFLAKKFPGIATKLGQNITIPSALKTGSKVLKSKLGGAALGAGIAETSRQLLAPDVASSARGGTDAEANAYRLSAAGGMLPGVGKLLMLARPVADVAANLGYRAGGGVSAGREAREDAALAEAMKKSAAVREGVKANQALPEVKRTPLSLPDTSTQQATSTEPRHQRQDYYHANVPIDKRKTAYLTAIGGPQTDINVARQRGEYLQKLSQDKLEQELAAGKAQQQAMTNYRSQQEALQARLAELPGDDPQSIALRNNVIRQIKAANLAAPQYLGGPAGPSSEDLAKRAGTQGMLPFQLQGTQAGLQEAQTKAKLAEPLTLAEIMHKQGIGGYYKALGQAQPALAEADKGKAAAAMLTAQSKGIKPLIDPKDALANLDNPAAAVYAQALEDTGGNTAQAMALTQRWIQQNSGE